ncbi:threonine dehydrogenase-like Zn-dependent dehydrogenase [Streptomyces avidinii]|uniref:Threonine dehydrogenase-like Zn-dependent dehydrogenase n=1 Tax=Streptomyces avidinii TaxID=1895 RepID=A0ABS4KXU2_STRAV|nr:threonine dehydrogenase-like Zn-dependent dehydrogenase [Streptomyces avidinii]
MNGLIDSVRFTGGIGDVGVFLPEGPGGAEAQGELEAQGKVPLDFGMLWFKGRRIGTGQAPVKRYNRALRDLIAGGRAEPSFLVPHELTLDEASSAYEHFDNRDDGWTKVVLHPYGSRSSAGGSSHHTLQELRREAKAQGIEGRSHMNKQQLERALES